MEYDDAQLIRDHLNGGEHAFPRFVERYLTPIYNFAYRLSGNAADAEDITQDTFIKVWRHAEKYRPGENVKTWLFTIAHRTAIDLLRKKKRLVFSDFESEDGGNILTDTLIDSEPTPEEIFVAAEEKALIEDLVSTLPPLYLEMLTLRYTEELTFDEIGKVLGKSLNTVKSQHRRAIIALRALIEHAPK